jgi:CubicO group peptidase (beta-lactamase class C family)
MKSFRHTGSSAPLHHGFSDGRRRTFVTTTGGNRSSVSDYLSRNPVTGLLVAKDDQILCEYYQYGRTDRDRLISQSMAKSITGLLIGAAIAEGAIKSVGDAAETYVRRVQRHGIWRNANPRPAAYVLGRGFRRDKGRPTRSQCLWIDMVLGMRPTHGTIESIVQFNRRIAPPGTRYFYASIEPDVLGVVLHYAVNRSASDY